MNEIPHIIVIKVGTNVVTREPAEAGGSRSLNLNVLQDLIRDIGKIRKETHDRVILVSSGAVASGEERIKMNSGNKIVDKQGYAVVGQPRLTATYDMLFERVAPELVPAQGLLTSNNFKNEVERERMLRVLKELPENVVPIINENDFIATQELTFGDNDQLAALVAEHTHSRLLVLLTDVDCVYDKPPVYEDARMIKIIPEMVLTDEWINKTCGDVKGEKSAGGMASKLLAARIVAAHGIPTVIAKGTERGNLYRIAVQRDQIGTTVNPESPAWP